MKCASESVGPSEVQTIDTLSSERRDLELEREEIWRSIGVPDFLFEDISIDISEFRARGALTLHRHDGFPDLIQDSTLLDLLSFPNLRGGNSGGSDTEVVH